VQELISPSISLLEGLDESAGRFQTTLLSLLSFNHSHPTKPLSQTRHLEYRRILARTGTSAPLTQPHIASQATMHKLGKDPRAKTKEIRDRLARLLRMLPRQNQGSAPWS
jgi:hypothetical protein